MPTPARGMTTASKTVLSAPFLLWTHKQINDLTRGAGEKTFSLLPLCYHFTAALIAAALPSSWRKRCA
jgi:hypothetical protein